MKKIPKGTTVVISNGNKLIGEFMDIYIGNGAYYNSSIPDIYHSSESSVLFEEDMKYHLSYDWLIPPVNKALNIIHEKMLNEWENSFCNSFLSGDMSLLYKELVDFIKWYNTLQ